MSEFTPSPHQAAFFDWCENGSGNGVMIAVAGSGKTTTIREAVKRCIPESARVLVLVFAKRNADEMAGTFPKNAKTSTFHSCAYGAYRRATDGNVRVDDKKVWNIIDGRIASMAGGIEDEARRLKKAYGAFVKKMVGYAKGEGIGYLRENTPEEWMKIVDHHDVDLGVDPAEDPNVSFEEGIEICREVLTANIADRNTVDFDDMLYMSLIHDVPFFKNDWVFLDEAQDTNACQQALLKRMVKPGGRLIAVGDPCQAIFGFRGAEAKAMQEIREDWNAVELPLTVSFRCPRAVVEEAKRVVSHIEAHPDAPKGVVRSVEGRDPMGSYGPWISELSPSDAVLCRNTAPLVGLAYALIGAGTGCKILGRDIGEGLIKLVDKMKAKGVEALIEKLHAYRERETAKALSKDQEEKAAAIEDRVDSLMAVIDGLPETDRTVPGVKRRLDEMFSDKTNGGIVTLCTVHRSKGLEWDRVYLLRPDLMPSRWARKEWQVSQEMNIVYVAYTRAKQELVFVNEK